MPALGCQRTMPRRPLNFLASESETNYVIEDVHMPTCCTLHCRCRSQQSSFDTLILILKTFQAANLQAQQ